MLYISKTLQHVPYVYRPGRGGGVNEVICGLTIVASYDFTCTALFCFYIISYVNATTLAIFEVLTHAESKPHSQWNRKKILL